MPFTIEKDSQCPDIIIFKLDKVFTKTDFKKLLTLLDRLLDLKKPFFFIINALDIESAPLKEGITLIKWLKENKSNIPGILMGSSIVLSYKKLIAVINYVFKIRKPISPNLITSDFDKGLAFLRDIKSRNLNET